MSVYDRAERPSFKLIGSTGQAVGPGTYDVDIPEKSKIRSDGYAPFSSMTTRDTHINLHDTSIAAPGPGQYDSHILREHVKGGSTLANRSVRFIEHDSLTPGPGAYDVRKLEVTGKTNKRQETSESGPHLVIVRKPDAPSIPTPGQAYGFEENEDGTLRRQEPPERDETIGPAFYNPEKPLTKVTETYKGIHWSKYSNKRTEFGGKHGPGPGEYDPTQQSSRRIEHLNMKDEDKKKFDAKIPRYHEWVVKEEERKAVPGPGRYDVKSGFDPESKAVNQEGVEVEHPPFLSQARRFAAVKNAVPAPGTYNDPRTALTALKKVTGLKRSPFGQTAVRFAPEHHVRKTPGPGSYNTPGLGQESMKKAYVESTHRGVFGTTSARIKPMVKRDDYFLPGPSHYAVKDVDKVHEPKIKQPMSVFSSLTNRIPEDPEAKAIPPPGSYEIDNAFKKSQLKRSPAPPRNEAAKQRMESFQSSSSRFAPPRDMPLKMADPVNPGPAAYDPNVKAIQNKGGKMVTKEKRFHSLKIDETPGPGQYEFSPLIADTVLKGTFNATLHNPITQRMLSQQPVGSQHAFILGV